MDRSDTGADNADVYFNYGSMQSETGDASSGVNGFGGSCAHAGYSNGTGNLGSFFELPGSGVCGSMINGGASQLQTSTNDNVPGQWLFEVRNGEIIQPTTGGGVVPEPTSLLLLGSGLFGAAMRLRRKNGKG